MLLLFIAKQDLEEQELWFVRIWCMSMEWLVKKQLDIVVYVVLEV